MIIIEKNNFNKNDIFEFVRFDESEVRRVKLDRLMNGYFNVAIDTDSRVINYQSYSENDIFDRLFILRLFGLNSKLKKINTESITFINSIIKDCQVSEREPD